MSQIVGKCLKYGKHCKMLKKILKHLGKILIVKFSYI